MNTKLTARLLCLLTAFSAAVLGAYVYYHSETLTTGYDSTKWQQNGEGLNGPPGGGIAISEPDVSVSRISKINIPDGTSDYEVKTTVNFNPASNAGQFITYFRATQDAVLDFNTNPGTFYAAVFTGGMAFDGTCGWDLYKRTGSGLQALTYSRIACAGKSSFTFRVAIKGSEIVTYIDNNIQTYNVDSSIASGKPGIGVLNNFSSGNYLMSVALGPIDRTNPGALNSNQVFSSIFPNRADFQWQGAGDDANGIGVAFYQVLRNGVWTTNLTDPTYSDTTVAASTSYTYRFRVVDYHLNSSFIDVPVTTPATGAVDPRRVGVRPTGNYWGAGSENIDLLSGNVGFSLPLLRAQARTGWSLPFSLSYNSQNWRKDSGGTWNLGADVGYGYGWKLLAGSLTPMWSGYYVLNHWKFTDASGAEYRLDQNTNGVWTTKEGGLYLWYDSNSQRLYFPDGSFWVFGSLSGGYEQDAGTRYPTLIQDTNGNRVLIRYYNGIGLAGENSSARIKEIEDVRATQPGGTGTWKTYQFTYNTDAIPHLTGITNTIGTSEGYSFGYSGATALNSPFSPFPAFGTAVRLNYIEVNGIGLRHNFEYNSSAELTKVILPYGGYFRYQYREFTYLSNRTLREVQTRYLSKDGSTETSYPFARDDAGDANRTIHYWTTVTDASGTADKAWFFHTDTATPWKLGLLFWKLDRKLPGAASLAALDQTWAQDANGKPYVSVAVETLDRNTAYEVKKKTEITVDAYGNVTQRKAYNYGNLVTEAWTQTFTYLTDTNYTSRYIRNRLVTAVVANSAPSGQLISSATAVRNYYDNDSANACPGYSTALTDRTGMREHDTANYGTGFAYRGNVIRSDGLNGTACAAYDIAGDAPNVRDVLQRSTSINYTSATNFAAPSSWTGPTYNQSMTWSSFLGLATATGANSESASTVYDTYARTQTVTSAHGAQTTYTYVNSPPSVTATTNGRWTKTSFDGLGRGIKTEAGDGGGTKTIVLTEYDSCACSPTGKMKRTSMPHAPGGTVYWTTYTYDALGRTLTVVAPDGASTTTYLYTGNKVRITDPAGKWKEFESDAAGSLTRVTEPNPAGGANYETTYTCDVLGQLRTVTMPRDGTTQTRTFTYAQGPAINGASNTGAFLTSMTQPESGTATFTYNSDGTLAHKIDAKNQKVAYVYDSAKRVTTVNRYTNSGDATPAEIVNYGYDYGCTGYSHGSVTGRLRLVWYSTAIPGTSLSNQFYDCFSYNAAGLVTAKRAAITRNAATFNLDSYYTYDNEGRLTVIDYPDTPPAYGPFHRLAYDSMGRLSGVKDFNNADIVNNVTYGPAGQLLTLSWMNYTETRQYNNLLQMTRLTAAGGSQGSLDLEYKFSSTQNNGRITAMKDWVTGEEVQYTYDALQRLTRAETIGPEWGSTYGYDGFGNLLQKTPVKGAGVPLLNIAVDPWTNRVSGLSGGSYDANGNDLTAGAFDIANRLKQSGSTYFQYDAANKRVWKGTVAGGAITSEEFYFYAPWGAKLAAYKPTNYLNLVTMTIVSSNEYFGGKLIKINGTAVLTDRLGSNVSNGKRYFPYGEERGSTANNIEKFGTYFRDAETGLDYADQRYYKGSWGRFGSADPTFNGINPAVGHSWNMFSYANADPVNGNDPNGLGYVLLEIAPEDGGGYRVVGWAPGSSAELQQAEAAHSQQIFGTWLVNGINNGILAGGITAQEGANLALSFGIPVSMVSFTVNVGIPAVQTNIYYQGGGADIGGQVITSSSAAGAQAIIEEAWRAVQGALSGTIDVSQFPPITLQVTVGTPITPNPIGVALSMLGLGASFTLIPQTGAVLIGPTGVLGAPGQGTGASLTIWLPGLTPHVPVDNFLFGGGASVAFQPYVLAGVTVAGSPNLSGLLYGYTIGTRVPLGASVRDTRSVSRSALEGGLC